MPKGGSRVRSGPAADPNSGRSEARRSASAKASASASAGSAITSTDFNPMALSAAGRKGRAPAFPLPRITIGSKAVDEEGMVIEVVDKKATDDFRKRELQVWDQLWKTPQALAWEREPWRWPTIAKYARITVSTESKPDASAALLSRERELRNECGLSPDGLKQNGWVIAPDQLAEKRAAKKAAAAPAEMKATPVRRLRG